MVYVRVEEIFFSHFLGKSSLPSFWGKVGHKRERGTPNLSFSAAPGNNKVP